MSNEISNVNSGNVQNDYPTAEEVLGAAGGEAATKAAEVTGAVVTALLKDKGLIQSWITGAVEKSIDPETGEIDLDEVAYNLVQDIDLEKLVALLQAETDEKTAETVKKRIEQLKSAMQRVHESRQTKINKSMEEQKKADDAAKRSKIFSIIGAIFAVVAAVITTVVTGGAAAGFAIAGAVLAVTNCALTLTGGDKAIMDLIADIDQKCNPGKSMKDSRRFAQKFYAYFGMALGAALAIGGGIASWAQSSKEMVKVFGKVLTKATLDTLKNSSGALGLGMSAINIGFGVDSAVKSDNASETSAQLEEVEEILVKLKKYLEDAEAALEDILSKLQDVFSELLEMIDGTANQKNVILDNLGSESYA